MTELRSLSSTRPRRLPARFLDKVWGTRRLSPWFPDSLTHIGEVWFEAELPLLVKFIFTAENLSVQVHPDDEYAGRYEDSLGKTEMWHILRADPGARIAMGFREAISPERFRETAASGEIEGLLNWVEVQAGETWFTPAGTVHAIGAGIALCEIQQYSDVTYRLYDYGRPRELHLEKASQVSDMTAYAAGPVPLPLDCEYFHTDLQWIGEITEVAADSHRFRLFIFLEGDGHLDGHSYRQGEAWLIPRGAEPFAIEPVTPTKFLRTWVP